MKASLCLSFSLSRESKANIIVYNILSQEQWYRSTALTSQSSSGRRLARFLFTQFTFSHAAMRNYYFVVLLAVLATLLLTAEAGDMMRKSIVFDKNTPDVFYCPVHKPTGFDKMIVKAKPLSRLCQFEGGPIPKDYKSDCYNDVDESEYACKEKYRIMKRLRNVDGDQLPVDNEYTDK